MSVEYRKSDLRSAIRHLRPKNRALQVISDYASPIRATRFSDLHSIRERL